MAKHPLNKIIRNRDKNLKKARDLRAQGKTEEADKAQQRAHYWERMLIDPEEIPPKH